MTAHRHRRRQPGYIWITDQVLTTLWLFGYATAVKLLLIISLRIVHQFPVFTTKGQP